jgi:hypothetical protein
MCLLDIQASAHPQTYNFYVIIIIIIIRISHFSALAEKYSPILGCIINRIRLGGLMCSLGNFLQLNMCQELSLLHLYICVWVQVKSL